MTGEHIAIDLKRKLKINYIRIFCNNNPPGKNGLIKNGLME